ncbi:CPBP family intramembrane glutamic endopeptidase [Naasia sp. SYSU D00948]|uniref:CPBP family intramembrane glutamic endopeptidase n=1 Tax=Naasia sp. SYSU D00948 TaxID=2817379 RepID=UPI001B3164B3|nr:type II CAAX endopeptidase family protein [Naasia sp. SYSU D00948]
MTPPIPDQEHADPTSPGERTSAGRAAGPSPRRLPLYLAITLGWSVLIGAGLSIARIPVDSLVGIVLIAALYMPSPLVAALLVERGLVRPRLRLPLRTSRNIAVFVLAPVAAMIGWLLLYLAVVLVAGNLLGLPAFGAIATSAADVIQAASALLGKAAVEAAGTPPPTAVLLIAGVWGAIIAGWTINGLFAMGEEYGWRGLMWEELRHRGAVAANVLTGVAWGLWHAPLILHGYNYPGFPLLGVLAMVALCIGMSFLLSGLRELTGSVLPVAAAHGMFNAVAPLLMLLVLSPHPILTGVLGLLGAGLFLVPAAVVWRAVLRRPRTT